MKLGLTLVAIATLALVGQVLSAADKAAPYDDDPGILKIFAGLDDNTSALLPFERDVPRHRGKRTADYSMRMVYAPERETALYAGGNHNNGRYNDCWEYHLGSNSWHELFAAEGGDHYQLKAIVMYEMRRVKRDMQNGETFTLESLRTRLDEKDRERLDSNIQWWKKNVVIERGAFTTPGGGPIMPSHTWDGLCYDRTQKRMLWSAGAGPNGEADLFHHFATGVPLDEVRAKLDPGYAPMWAFDPAQKQWQRYYTPRHLPCPDFRGMGQSLVYLTGRGEIIWYIAASNVVPQSYQMWRYDPSGNIWSELKPNGGQAIASLVKQGHAPGGEQVIRYSPQQKKLYAFRQNGVFTYDLASNVWSQVATDDRIDAHDARTAISYDTVNDVFLYARKQTEGEQLDFAVFDPADNTWSELTPQGEPLPKPRWQSYKGFFHERLNAYVLALGNEPVWVYRYKRRPSN